MQMQLYQQAFRRPAHVYPEIRKLLGVLTKPVAPIDLQVPPQLDAAYAFQRELIVQARKELRWGVAGWKLGGLSPADQQLQQTDRPYYTPIFAPSLRLLDPRAVANAKNSARSLALAESRGPRGEFDDDKEEEEEQRASQQLSLMNRSGAAVVPCTPLIRGVEVGLALEVVREVRAKDVQYTQNTNYTMDELLGQLRCVGRVFPCVELVGSRVWGGPYCQGPRPRPPPSATGQTGGKKAPPVCVKVADAGATAALICGQGTPLQSIVTTSSGSNTPLAELSATLSINGEVVGSGDAATQLGGDPLKALVHLVNQLTARGFPLQPGMVVALGPLCASAEVRPGDVVAANFGPKLGVVEVELAEALPF